MLEKMFLDVNKLFSKFEFKPVVVYPSSTSHCCISCRTFDDKVFVYAESNEDNYEDDYNPLLKEITYKEVKLFLEKY